MVTKAEFIEFVSEKVAVQWGEEQRPLLLSNIPTLWRAEKHVSYKEIVGEVSLKRFLAEAARDDGVGFKVVANPSVLALVGLIPKHETFEFSRGAPAPKAVTAQRPTDVVDSNEKVVRDFLALVAKLPSEDIKKVIIPVEILTQLMFEK